MGRPSSYTPVLAERVCELVAEGKSLRAIEDVADMPSMAAVMRWLGKDGAEFDSFRQQYARSREIRADARFERIDCVLVDMRAGTIDAQQARVEIDAIKWQAGREKPKVYGDAMTLKGDKDNPLRVATTKDMSDAELASVATGGLANQT